MFQKWMFLFLLFFLGAAGCSDDGENAWFNSDTKTEAAQKYVTLTLQDGDGRTLSSDSLQTVLLLSESGSAQYPLSYSGGSWVSDLPVQQTDQAASQQRIPLGKYRAAAFGKTGEKYLPAFRSGVFDLGSDSTQRLLTVEYFEAVAVTAFNSVYGFYASPQSILLDGGEPFCVFGVNWIFAAGSGEYRLQVRAPYYKTFDEENYRVSDTSLNTVYLVLSPSYSIVRIMDAVYRDPLDGNPSGAVLAEVGGDGGGQEYPALLSLGSGMYLFNVPAGLYELEVTMNYYETYSYSRYRVYENEANTVELTLSSDYSTVQILDESTGDPLSIDVKNIRLEERNAKESLGYGKYVFDRASGSTGKLQIDDGRYESFLNSSFYFSPDEPNRVYLTPVEQT